MVWEERTTPHKKKASEYLVWVVLGVALISLFYGIQKPVAESGTNNWINFGLISLVFAAVLFIAWCYNRFGD